MKYNTTPVDYVNQNDFPLDSNVGADELPEIFSAYRARTNDVRLTRDLTVFGVTVPKKFRTNFVTTRWYIRWLIPKFSRANHAAVVHDWRYTTGNIPRKEADIELRVNLKACGYSDFMAGLYYYGVRIAGAAHYNNNKA